MKAAIVAITNSKLLNEADDDCDFGSLCGNKRCIEPKHLVVEPKAWATSRQYCQSTTCIHQRAGKYMSLEFSLTMVPQKVGMPLEKSR